MNDEAGFARSGEGGCHQEKVELLVAKFAHFSDRAETPQMHVHALARNLGECEDEKFRALDGGRILAIKKAGGAFFRSALVEELQVAVERDPEHKWAFRVKGVPESVTEEWSKRSREIEEEAKRINEDSAKAKALIALSTRDVKGHRPLEELQVEWTRTAHEHGFTEEQAREILSQRGPELSQKAALRIVDASIETTVSKLLEQQATFSKHALVTQVCIETVEQAISPVLIYERIQETLDNERFIALGRHRHQEVWTTAEIYHDIEGKALEAAAKLSSRHHRPIKDERIEQVIAAANAKSEDKKLNEGQCEVIHKVCQGSDLVLVQGPPGTGKSTTFRAVHEALATAHSILERNGVNVIGIAPTNKAAVELQASSNIESYTLDKFLLDQEKSLYQKVCHGIEMVKRSLQDRPVWNLSKIDVNDKTTIVIDECSMVENAKLGRVLDLAWKTGARVVLVGDHQQLPAIGQGGMYREIWMRADDEQKASLTENVRQRHEWHKESIALVGQGKIAEALAAYNERGFLHVAPTRESAEEQLIEAWKAKGIADPRTSIILAPTNREVDSLNEKAQAARLEAGELSSTKQVRVGETILREGDRVIWTEQVSNRGIVKNQFANITNIDVGTSLVTAKVDGKETPVVFSPITFQNLKLGYAVTVHRAQGITLDQDAFVMLGGAGQAKEMTYVQVSRAKDNTHLFTDERTAGRELSGLIQQLSRSDEKLAARTIARQNEIDLSNTLHLSL